MSENSDRDRPVPRATVVKRYGRLVNRGIGAVACLACVALFAVFVLAETFPFLQDSGGPTYSREQRDARLFSAFIAAVVKWLRVCGMSSGAIRISAAAVVAVSLAAIVGVVVYVKRAAPPKAQRLRKKEAIVQ